MRWWKSKWILRRGLCRFIREQAERQGTAEQAIEFALTIDDHFDMRGFLNNWLEGDLDDWPEYQPEKPKWSLWQRLTGRFYA